MIYIDHILLVIGYSYIKTKMIFGFRNAFNRNKLINQNTFEVAFAMGIFKMIY